MCGGKAVRLHLAMVLQKIDAFCLAIVGFILLILNLRSLFRGTEGISKDVRELKSVTNHPVFTN